MRRRRDRPRECSEARDDEIRVAFLSPLAVPFYIETEAQIVYIMQASLTD